MASNTAAEETNHTPEPEWNEDKLVSSLARLQEIHVELRNLRTAIPKIVNPLLLRKSSPEALYVDFSRTATSSVKDIKNLTTLLEDSRSQAIFDRAKEVRAKNPEWKITGWMVTEQQDWLDVRKEASPQDSAEEKVEDITLSNGLKEDDYRAALKKFGESHTGLETSLLTEGSNVMEIYLPSPVNLRFRVEPKYNPQNQTSYVITSPGKSKMHVAVLDEIANRPNPNNLNYLLEMLASYADLKSSPCLKCRRLLDTNAQFPAVRKRTRTKTTANRYTTQWQALHKSCL